MLRNNLIVCENGGLTQNQQRTHTNSYELRLRAIGCGDSAGDEGHGAGQAGGGGGGILEDMMISCYSIVLHLKR